MALSYGYVGELGLDGSLRPVSGTLALVHAMGSNAVVVPAGAWQEASLLAGSEVRAAHSLKELAGALRGLHPWARMVPSAPAAQPWSGADMADVRGQAQARLAVEVAAAGGHHILMVGPPGAGKTMLAERLPGLLPPLKDADALEVTRIHSAAGLPAPPGVLVRRPPFRAPHHGASAVSLIGGGGQQMRPGELSCAHRGVLFLDELGEFPPSVLDSLRQPLEEGRVLVCRARASVVFPARVLLVAAMNPCPCGGDGGPGACRCRESALARYRSRVSGPLLDRFDLRVQVARPEVGALLGSPAVPPAETTAAVAARVASCRAIAASRGIDSNSAIAAHRLDALAPMDRAATRCLDTWLRQGYLSARGAHRIRRVARTVADLDGRAGALRAEDLETALALREDVFPRRAAADDAWSVPAAGGR